MTRAFAYTDATFRRILTRTKTIAAVGVSANPIRPSHYVGRYLAGRGYRVIPINPASAGEALFGQRVHSSLADIPKSHDPIDMVDVFRRSDQAGAVVDEALEVLLDRGLKTIWMQFNVIDSAAAKRAEAAGVEVIMDHCPKLEHQRLYGELRKAGFNTGIISSKL